MMGGGLLSERKRHMAPPQLSTLVLCLIATRCITLKLPFFELVGCTMKVWLSFTTSTVHAT